MADEETAQVQASQETAGEQQTTASTENEQVEQPAAQAAQEQETEPEKEKPVAGQDTEKAEQEVAAEEPQKPQEQETETGEKDDVENPAEAESQQAAGETGRGNEDTAEGEPAEQEVPQEPELSETVAEVTEEPAKNEAEETTVTEDVSEQKPEAEEQQQPAVTEQQQDESEAQQQENEIQQEPEVQQQEPEPKEQESEMQQQEPEGQQQQEPEASQEAETGTVEKKVADLTDEEMNTFQELFEIYATVDEKDGQQKLSRPGIKILFRSMGEIINDSMLSSWMKEEGYSNGQDKLNFQQFCGLYSKKRQPQDTRRKELLMSVNTLFPLNGEPDDVISLEKVSSVMKQLNSAPGLISENSLLNDTDIDSVIARFDTKGNKKISRQELVDFLSSAII